MLEDGVSIGLLCARVRVRVQRELHVHVELLERSDEALLSGDEHIVPRLSSDDDNDAEVRAATATMQEGRRAMRKLWHWTASRLASVQHEWHKKGCWEGLLWHGMRSGGSGGEMCC